ncbi:RND transporter [Devosia pacifica]|uniref:RND transporter n=1 Tax=Devosia pacifica TaxID=1335967 RepID=A0A918SAK0_9HYPH|nr:efflux RND transporter periplasmic adaptor subunit [Devosia pacifica]GHA31507.1 RND transporter [Devosia pacifica]
MSNKPEWAKSKREKENAARVAAGEKPRRRRWPWIVLVLIVLAAIIAGVVIAGQQPAEEAQPVEDTAALALQLLPQEVTELEPMTLEHTIKVTGSLNPERQTQLSSQVSAPVVAVLARPGDEVQQGDTLVQMQTRTLENQLEQATSTAAATRVQLQLAQSQLERTQNLIERGLSPTSGLDEAQSSVDAQQANLAALEAQVAAAEIAIDNATVRAPFTGTISDRAVEPGQVVQPGSPLLTLVDLDTVQLEGSAPVGQSTRIRSGQRVNVSVEGLARTFVGTVERLNPVATAGTRSIPVYIELNNEDGLLRGGMFATGQIIVETLDEAIAVPPDAVREDAQGLYVLKLVENVVERQSVETGGEWNQGNLVAVTAGLSAGDRVVTAPLAQVEPGDPVEVMEP